MGDNTAEDDRSNTSWALIGQELRMSDDNRPNQDLPADYASQGSSPTEELREIARIHHREAKELLEHSHQAKAEGREEEAKLLMDLWVAREERAMEFDKAARGEGGDPIVNEILDWQEDLCELLYPTYHWSSSQRRNWPPIRNCLSDLRAAPLGPIARAVAWFGSWKH
jgi:hypothetical protein